MSNKFLTTSSGSINLSNGTVDIFAESLGADNLEASRPLRTNAVKKIVSSNLNISDVNDLQTELTTKQELTFVNNDSHTTPQSGQTKLYVKSDGTFYKLDSSGNEQNIGGAGYELIPSKSGTTDIHYESKYDKTTWLDTGSTTDYNLYNYFSSAKIPECSLQTSTQTSTTCSTEAELDTAISNQQSIIITNSFTLTTQKTINYSVFMATDGNWHTLTGNFDGPLFTISSDNNIVGQVEFVNTNTGSNCNCINFSSPSATNNVVITAYFQTNEFAISSANAQIAIITCSFTFLGTPDSHHYIILSRTTGTTQILNNKFRGNGASTPSTACVLFTGESINYSGGTFIFSDNSSDGTAIQRVGIMEVLPSPLSDFKMYFTNNTIITNTDFFILYGDVNNAGISEIVLSNNNVSLIPTSAGFKGLIGIDMPTPPSPITIVSFPRVRASQNTLPTTIRSDYTLFPKCTTDLPIVCYRSSKFDHEMEVYVEPPLVYTFSGGGGGISNPYVGTLIVSDLETDDTFSLNQEIQKISNISSAENNPDITDFSGEIHVAKIKSASHNTEIEFEPEGNMTLNTDGDINISSVGDTNITTVDNDIQLTATEIRLNSSTLTANGQNVVTKEKDPIAIGNSAGLNDQSIHAVAIGTQAGENTQGGSCVAIGIYSGQNSQEALSVAIGIQSGQNSQKQGCVSIGPLSGQSVQGTNAVAIGLEAGRNTQGINSVALGTQAGSFDQKNNAVAIGYKTGEESQGANAVALGTLAGAFEQKNNAVAIGYKTGEESQGANAVAIGRESGHTNQGAGSVAIGRVVGQVNQGVNAVAIGNQTGQNTQGSSSIAIGLFSGQNVQGNNSIAIGTEAGRNTQGQYSIAIGNGAGENSLPANSICLNASATALSPTTDGVFMSSVKNKGSTVTTKSLVYDSQTQEVHTVDASTSWETVTIDEKLQLTTYINLTPSIGDLWKDGDDVKFRDSVGIKTFQFNFGPKLYTYTITGVGPGSFGNVVYGLPSSYSTGQTLTVSDIVSASGFILKNDSVIFPMGPEGSFMSFYIRPEISGNDEVVVKAGSINSEFVNKTFKITIIATK